MHCKANTFADVATSLIRGLTFYLGAGAMPAGHGRRLSLAALVMLFSSPQLFAQTNVGGAIDAETTWAASSGPYVVTSDVTVQNGATLTIEAGTAVYMGTGTSLTVSSGKLQALGTPQAPITVSSDAMRLGQAGAAGQWNHWTFGSGTTNTKLEHVIFEFGKGLQINGSAPVFNYVQIRNQAGPAMALNLAASPTGVGNSAAGCTKNAIVVPSGDLIGNVTWGVRGIPYLVQSGRVSVGLSPAIDTISPTQIEQGETKTITLNGTRLTGANVARFSASGLSASVLAGGSASQKQLSATAAPDAAMGLADLLVIADAGEIRVPGAISVIRPQPYLTGLNPSSVYAWQGPVQSQSQVAISTPTPKY